MVNKQKVISGCQRYIDEQIVPKMSGWQRWVFGAGAGVILSRADGMISMLKQNQFMTACGIFNGDDVDVDVIYRELKKQAVNSGSITVSVPMIGNITLSENDIDCVYQYIIS